MRHHLSRIECRVTVLSVMTVLLCVVAWLALMLAARDHYIIRRDRTQTSFSHNLAAIKFNDYAKD